MGNRLDNTELEKALDEIFKFLKSKGINVNDDAKADFKKQIANDLYKDLTMDDIKNVNVQKKLISCIVSLVMGKDSEYQETIENLKDDDKKLEKPDPKLETRLTAQLMILTMLSKLIDDNKHELPFKNEPKLTPDTFKQKILEPQIEKAKPEDKKKVEEAISKQLDDCLRNLYGGTNPTMGGIPGVVQEVIGDLIGLTNQTTPDPNSCAEMVQKITFNTSKTDDLGLENITMLNDLGEGIEMNLNLMTPRLTQ